MSAVELIATKDGWVVPLDGCTVAQCRVDYSFTFVIDGARGSFEIRIEQSFELVGEVEGDRPVSLNVEDEPTALAPALALLRAAVHEALAFEDGRLELRFDNGRVRVPASEEFEAWTLVGPDGLRLVSMPEGALAVWSPDGSAAVSE